MTWIKLGAYYLNLDRVASIEINEHTVGGRLEITVFYTAGMSEAGRINDTFTGEEAARLLEYLNSHIVNPEDDAA